MGRHILVFGYEPGWTAFPRGFRSIWGSVCSCTACDDGTETRLATEHTQMSNNHVPITHIYVF